MIIVLVSFAFFFFFQAEDGIRDYKVTGVQTCALPIWLLALAAHADAGPVGQRHGPRTRRLLTRGAKQHDVREVNGRFPLQDPSLSVLLARLRMPLDDVDLFDRDLAVETEHAEDLAGFAAILARHDDDRVPLAHMALGRNFQGAEIGRAHV